MGGNNLLCLDNKNSTRKYGILLLGEDSVTSTQLLGFFFTKKMKSSDDSTAMIATFYL